MRRMAMAVVVLLTTAACGGGIEEAAERIAESQGAGDVDVEFTDDSVAMSFSNEDGAFAIGGDLDVPAGLTFPLPGGGVVTTAGTQDSYVFAAVEFPRSRYVEIVDFYKDWVASDGRDWSVSESMTDMGDMQIRNAMWVTGASAISVGECFGFGGSELDAVCVTLNESS